MDSSDSEDVPKALNMNVTSCLYNEAFQFIKYTTM